jgi:putative ABC transport system permease protein
MLPMLGVQPVRGRGFSAEEAERRQRVALISHALWQTRFGGARDATGATLEIDGAPSQIIGILPADLQFPKVDADVWEPHTLFPDWEPAAPRAVRVRGSSLGGFGPV